jgi:hypothetical protein
VALRAPPGHPARLRGPLTDIVYRSDAPFPAVLEAFRYRACAGLAGEVSGADHVTAEAMLDTMRLTSPAALPN